jgi:hypothetical protein
MTARELQKIIREYHPHADPVADEILAACNSTGLPLSYGLTLLEKESGFQNVFGHDPVRNPVKGGRVTQARYAEYKRHRKRGEGMQGVGYTQLTWFAYQDQADALGGCWRPYPNIVVGFRLIRNLTHVHGIQKGAARFNGTGPAADAYGRDFLARQRKWHVRVTH